MPPSPLYKELNFPKYDFNLKTVDGLVRIFDSIRKRWIVLTPEEWVRQHTIRYLTIEKKFPPELIAVEMPITVNDTSKRCDIVLFNVLAEPLLIVECKAPNVALTQKTLDQTAVYNLTLKVKNLLITNGLYHHFCKVDYENKKYVFLNEIPNYEELCKERLF